jgi:tRNA N6-adenosine threonylcarbamoyltransferase
MRRPCLSSLRNCGSKAFRRYFTVLGIETSCDDTCIAVLDINPSTPDPPKILHNIRERSLQLNEPHGGIVPNIVGQFHAKNLARLLAEVSDQGAFKKLDLIAVTRGFIQVILACLTPRPWDSHVFGCWIEHCKRSVGWSESTHNWCTSYGISKFFLSTDITASSRSNSSLSKRRSRASFSFLYTSHIGRTYYASPLSCFN